MNKTTEALKLAEEALHAELEAINSDEFDAAADKCYEALAAIREALAEPVKQEPVAVISESAIGLVKLHSNGACLPFGTPLYAAPVDAKAIRAEALEQAAKVCEQGTGDAVQTDVLKALWKERERIAEVIRGLK